MHGHMLKDTEKEISQRKRPWYQKSFFEAQIQTNFKTLSDWLDDWLDEGIRMNNY